jgi:hypothetical protein
VRPKRRGFPPSGGEAATDEVMKKEEELKKLLSKYSKETLIKVFPMFAFFHPGPELLDMIEWRHKAERALSRRSRLVEAQLEIAGKKRHTRNDMRRFKKLGKELDAVSRLLDRLGERQPEVFARYEARFGKKEEEEEPEVGHEEVL